MRWLLPVLALAACSSKSSESNSRALETPASGVIMTYQLELPAGADAAAAGKAAVAAVRERLAAIDVRDVEVDFDGVDRIQFLVDDAAAARARPLFEQRGHLAIRAVVANHPAMLALARGIGDDPRAATAGVRRDVDQWYGQGRTYDDNYLSAPSRAALTEYVDRAHPELPADHEIVYERVAPANPGGELRWRTYLVGEAAGLAGHVADATASTDPQTNKPIVTVSFDDEGKRRFADFTTRHAGGKLAILINGEVSSAPVLMEPITGGQVWVNLAGDDPATAAHDARALADTLRLAALPTPMRLMKVEPFPPARP